MNVTGLAELAQMVSSTFEGNDAMRALYPLEPEAIAAFMAQELERVGAARLEDGVLVAQDSA